MKNIVILGSTGSIGRQAVDVVSEHPDEFNVIAMSAGKNVELLAEQARILNPDCLAVSSVDALPALQAIFPEMPIFSGDEGAARLVKLEDADIVLNAIVGAAGLRATISALAAGKILALANKESLVVAGELVMKTLQKNPEASIIPVDSEHSAIYQCLIGEDRADVDGLILTASGGPFRDLPSRDLEAVTPEQASNHPRWRMGKKISVDSATMVNKGLEVIEAHYLFNMDCDRIDIIIHPQSIVHSFVRFADGSLKAQLGPTDMRLPIQYALTYPQRLHSSVEPLSLSDIGSLTFEPLIIDRFPCLKLVMEAAAKGLSWPAAMNAANEEAVSAFLSGRIKFTQIGDVIGAVLDSHEPRAVASITDWAEIDGNARRAAQSSIGRFSRS